MTTIANDVAAVAGGKPAKTKPYHKEKRYGQPELTQGLARVQAEFLVYEPLFRSIMGMGVGWWQLES